MPPCGIIICLKDNNQHIRPVKFKMELDRRKNPRFPVRNNAFAIFKSEPDKLIPIVDISLGGLGLGVNGIITNAEELAGASRLEILTDDCHFYMDQLPYELLLPYRNFPQNAVGSFQHIYGIQFIELMSSQRNRLKYFIRSHTRGGMTPKFFQKVSRHLHHFISKKDFGDACRNLRLQRPSI